MHGNKESDLESLDELSGTKGIAIPNAPVNGEHYHIEAVGNLADVLQLAQILLLMGYGVNVFVKLLTIDGLTRRFLSLARSFSMAAYELGATLAIAAAAMVKPIVLIASRLSIIVYFRFSPKNVSIFS